MGSNQPLDRQSAAYREMTEKDRVADEDLPPATPGEVFGPEWWEAEGWDHSREFPKTVAEAEQALEARIADDQAPDTEAHRGVYRQTGDD